MPLSVSLIRDAGIGIQALNKIKETPNILASIFERVLNNQNLAYFNAFCLLLFMSFDMFIKNNFFTGI